MQPFIVYALPRSRTYWLSHYLTYGDWQCGHDQLRYCRSMDDIGSWFAQGNTGTVETAAAPFWRLAQNLKTVTIRRPVEEVVESFARCGFTMDIIDYVRRLDRKLDQIEHRVPGVLSVTFDELKSEEACKRVFEHCLPYQHDHDWYARMVPLNLQVNLRHMVRYFLANAKQMDDLSKVAKHKTIALISQKLAHVEHDDGFTFREEKFADMFDDAKRLFADHLLVVGEPPDNFMNKNLELFQRLEDIGCLQIMTARSNGRMFGYLFTMITPSLESRDITIATQTVFYVDPSCKGLGLRLERAAVERLREKGVDEAYFHAGPRGSGPRIGALYRRIGAKDFGQWYKLDLSK